MPISYADHSDSVQTKLQLLQAAHANGEHDLAMSLAYSINDTLSFERQQAAPPQADIGSDDDLLLRDLPGQWSGWASGWGLAKPVSLFETVGIAREAEPVELTVAFHVDEIDDPVREVRVARIDPDTRFLSEVRSQVWDDRRHDDERHCRVMFFADVPAHERADYLILYANRFAELPHYESDLTTTGEGYALDIENAHYVARLSRQVGQLERLTYKRQHGLELYAGGKGHGEPPGIDWGHDYVDKGHFQKHRMRNWAECPNFEVVKGPLCVRVRRWGFPHSPLHPVFTPARMHMDQTYTFVAGQPYFFKEGRMDNVQEHRIEAMRDDEWVFSGYSFTEMLWIDAQGKLHEGAVPTEQAENIWGVGFYHDVSRDAFMALRLDHSAVGVDGPAHGGVPTLHYDGHGQLWSRYPAQQRIMPAGSSVRQRNAYTVAPFPTEGAAEQLETLRHQLQHPLEVRPADLNDGPRPQGQSNTDSLARFGETQQTGQQKLDIWKTLNEVKDEQLYNIESGIVDLGYVYDVRLRAGIATITLTMPHRGRPVYEFLVTQGGGRVEKGIRERLLALKGVRDVVINFTWDPAWTTARLSTRSRKELGIT
ncbi:MAG: hypothetical protein KDA93_21380 [Planctomycetaceae bacterium]|nr:hypothetical protein [Planctomycetaceae bacterium]